MMQKIFYPFFVLSALFLFNSCYEETKVLVNSQFQIEIENNNHTAPVKVNLHNLTTGADFYQWTFEGGNPSSSKDQNPTAIVYDKAGIYTIKLEAWNNNERDVKELTFSVDSAVIVKFETEILVNDHAPAEVKIKNLTEGASSYEWTFEGGIPSSSTEQHPANIHFNESGEHKITLKVSNGREVFTTNRTITLHPKIDVKFDMEPSFDDFDYEVPFTANLLNKSDNALTYEWIAEGGVIENKSATNTKVSFTTPGVYTITLKASNGKETKTYNREITLKKNSNLYTLKDVKFGIHRAQNTIGSFFSLNDRRILKKDEINSSNEKNVSLVFFGLDSGFSRCYFTSPDQAHLSGFSSIPNASKTYFVNDLAASGLSFSDSDFASMIDDAKLRQLNIKTVSNTTFFTYMQVPRLILFETADGVKGAIRIKAFVSDTDNSYILSDIKVQKENSK